MKKTLQSSFFTLLLFSTTSFSQDLDWAKTTMGSNAEMGTSVAVDPLGNVFTVGNFKGTATFGTSSYSASSEDIFIHKYSSIGNFEWAKKIGGDAIDNGRAIAVDNKGNVYVTGSFEGSVDFDPGPNQTLLIADTERDVFVVKLDPSGNFLWAKRIGGPKAEESRSIVLDALGNAYLTGIFQGTADFNPGDDLVTFTSGGDDDVFVEKLDSNGNYVWAKTFGSTGKEEGNSIGIDSLGNVYTAGSFVLSADFDPSANVDSLTSAGAKDIFVHKLDNNGNYQWAKRIGASVVETANALAVDPQSGNLHVIGIFNSTVDFDPNSASFNLSPNGFSDVFTLKLTSTGNFVWAKKLGGAETDNALSIAVDNQGYVYNVGIFKGTVDFDPSAAIFQLSSTGLSCPYMQALSPTGTFVWAKKLDGNGLKQINDIYLGDNGAIHGTGSFTLKIDLDPSLSDSTIITSTGDAEAFTFKLKPIPVGLEEAAFGTEMNAFPNPTSGPLLLDLGKQFANLKVEVHSASGDLLYSESHQTSRLLPLELNGPSGLYFVHLKSPEGGSMSLKIVKH